jgi:EAL domain-containing protein (putative c-di-GMP-specific phosphodiesterase class I)
MVKSQEGQPVASLRPRALSAVACLGWALAIAAATAMSRSVAFSDNSFSLFWPAAGIGVALLLYYGLSALLPICIGITGWATFALGTSATALIGANVAALIGPLVAWLLLRAEFASLAVDPDRYPSAFIQRKTIIAFLKIEALVAAPIAAIVGVGAFVALGKLSITQAPIATLAYFAVELCGAAFFAPIAWSLLHVESWSDLPVTIGEYCRSQSAILITTAAFLLVSVAAIYGGHRELVDGLMYTLLPLLALSAVRNASVQTHWTLMVCALAVLSVRAMMIDPALASATHSVDEKRVELFGSSFFLTMTAIAIHLLVAIVRERADAFEKLSESQYIDAGSNLLNLKGLHRWFPSTLQPQNGSGSARLTLIGVHLINNQAVQQLSGAAAAANIDAMAAQVLKTAIPEYRWACLGEGEFAALGSNEQDVAGVCQKLQTRLSGTGYSGNSVGGLAPLAKPVWAVAALTAPCESSPPLEALLLSLSDALDQATKLQRPIVQTLEGHEYLLQRESVGIEESVRSAIDNGRVEIFAQPIVRNVDSSVTLQKIEVLARFLDREGHVMQPGPAFAAAIRQGLMPALDNLMIQKTFAWFAIHPRQLDQLQTCSINLSAGSLSDADLVRRLELLLNQYRLPSEKFTFEITESELIGNLEVAQQVVSRIRELGFKVALDDFGTGLATFDYLKRFQVDSIKIDGRFIANLDRNITDQAIVSSIVRLANEMKLETVAEYITSAEIHQLVRELGVHESQGFAIGKPAPLSSWFEATTALGETMKLHIVHSND